MAAAVHISSRSRMASTGEIAFLAATGGFLRHAPLFKASIRNPLRGSSYHEENHACGGGVCARGRSRNFRPDAAEGRRRHTGPYEVVAGWPQNWCGAGYQIGSTAGIWAETPDRVIVFSRGCLPCWRNPGTCSDPQRVGLRPVAEGSRPPSPLGPHHQHRGSQRPARGIVGAAQQAVRPAAPRTRESVRSRAARLVRGRRRARDFQVHARRQAARADDRHAGCRATTRRICTADRHRLAARRDVLRERWLHQYSRREVRRERQVRHDVGHARHPANETRPTT